MVRIGTDGFFLRPLPIPRGAEADEALMAEDDDISAEELLQDERIRRILLN